MQEAQTLVNFILTLFLGLGGLCALCRLKFCFFRRPSLLIPKNQRASPDVGLSPYSALCIALGGTIGVGNTIGVASALCMGGPGAVFWMWVSALLGMALKYAEVFLAQLHRDGKSNFGGAMYLLEKLNKPTLAKFFSISCLLVSFGMGNLAQSGAAAASLKESFGFPPQLCAIVLTLCCFWIFCGGLKRLGSFSRFFVPFASVIFFLLCGATLCKNHSFLPAAIQSIFVQAFDFKAVGGGLFASVFAKSLSVGFTRGIFSNEAGLGSAPLVHSATHATPQEQALWGAREVFLDTHVVCTLCALCILSSPVWQNGADSPATLCTQVFHAALGEYGAKLFAVSLFLFATASILTWCHYGRQAAYHLFSANRIALFLYFALYFSLAYFGTQFEFGSIILYSDIANACMTLPNLYALWNFRHDLSAPEEKRENCLHFVHNSNKSYGKINT